MTHWGFWLWSYQIFIIFSLQIILILIIIMLIIIVWMRPGCDCDNLLQFKNAAELGPRTQTVQEASVHLQREVLQFDTVPLSTTHTHVSSSNLVLFAPKTATDPSFPAHISLSSLQISACKSSPSHRRNSHDEIQCAQIICLSAFLTSCIQTWWPTSLSFFFFFFTPRCTVSHSGQKRSNNSK